MDREYASLCGRHATAWCAVAGGVHGTGERAVRGEYDELCQTDSATIIRATHGVSLLLHIQLFTVTLYT